jgi:PAS domain S-box-containing protein
MPPLDKTEALRTRLGWFLFARVLLASGFLGALAFLYLRTGAQRYTLSIQLLLLAIALIYCVTILSALVLMRVRRLSAFAYGQLVFDCLLVTFVIFITAGGDSPFSFLYGTVVIEAAVLMGTPGAVAIAAVSSISYAALVAVLGSGLVARPDYPFPPSPPDLQFALRFVTNNASFFLVGILAGSLTRRLQHTEVLLEEREAERDRLSQLNEALARNIDSALVTTDPDGIVTSLNRATEELAGMIPQEVEGKEIGTVFPPLRLGPTGRPQFLQSASVQPTEFAHRTPDGRELVVRCSAVPLRNTYGHPIGALYILQDVTTLRRLEERAGIEAVQEQLADAEAPDNGSSDGLIGASPVMARVRDFIDKASRSDATVLIGGESGTGKELVARAIHARSNRGERPFIPVNCAALPEGVIESELFGHVKGAFTGAVAPRAGLFRAADGGTIFLDEIGDVPPALQVKLLRVLQERTFTPVGSDRSVTVDVRIVAATNRQLAEEVLAGRFREDLFYRLNVLAIELPPLRERRQDVPLLIRRFLRQFADLHGKQVQRLSVGAARRLQDYPYPGNVRELENIIEHAVALCEGETVREDDLPEYVLQPSPLRAPAPPPTEPVAPPPVQPPDVVSSLPSNLDDSLASYEKAILLEALARAGGVKKRAAVLLGINYRSLRHRLEKYGLGEALGFGDN